MLKQRYERYEGARRAHRLEGREGDGREGAAKAAGKGIGAGDATGQTKSFAGIGDYGNESMTHTCLIFMPSFRV